MEEQRPMAPEPVLEDVRYEVEDGLAWITITRPERYNSFRARTVDELIAASRRAWADPRCRASLPHGRRRQGVLHRRRPEAARRRPGDYGPSVYRTVRDRSSCTALIRDVPKPVIAAVNGFAIGGGHVLHVLCDLTDRRRPRPAFGQTGPRVGSRSTPARHRVPAPA